MQSRFGDRGKAEGKHRLNESTAPLFYCRYCGKMRIVRHIPYCRRKAQKREDFEARFGEAR